MSYSCGHKAWQGISCVECRPDLFQSPTQTFTTIQRMGEPPVVIDDLPVKLYLQTAESGDVLAELELLKTLNVEQLRSALAQLASMFRGKARHAAWLQTEKGVKRSQEVIQVAKAAKHHGSTLWAELLNGDEP